MGLIGDVVSIFFGGNRNILRETVEVFQENAELGAERDSRHRAAVAAQFAAEFATPGRASLFDRAIDGLNRLPRPMMAFGVLGLMGSAMVNPVWFSARMQGLALVPEPLWWLLGGVVSFYFGARQRQKSMDFQRSIAESFARTPDVVQHLTALSDLRHSTKETAELTAQNAAENPALGLWKQSRSEHR